jgi:SPP1 gp7 family putative phage head morphogenesis protein
MWGAHQVDGRISAKNAVKIRAALRQSIDARQVYEMYQATSPAVSDNNAQDRARARAWAIMNVRFINESLRTALMRLFAEAWVTGQAAADEAIYEEEALRKAGEIGFIDWSKWQPGDKATALLLEPTGAFKRILDRTGTTITGLDKTGYELVGTALADSIRAGYSPAKAAKLIQDAVGSPARALTIAVTESSRVMNSAAIDRYQEAGIDTMEWTAVQGGGTSVACDVCAQNAGEKRKIGQPFSTGKTQPPQHPHCRCNLRPVVPDYDDMFDEQGNLLPLKPNNNGVSDIMPSSNTPEQMANFQIQRGFKVTEKELETIKAYQNTDYEPMNRILRIPKATPDKYNDRYYYDPLNPVKWKKTQAKITELKEVIMKAPALEEPIVVFRGVKSDAKDKLLRLKAGSTYEEPGFVSTSFEQKASERFLGENGVMLEIVVPAGTRGLSVQPFSKEFFNGVKEYEWLMAPGTKFKVISRVGKVIKVEVIP